MKLTPVPAERVDEVWPRVLPYIDRACKHSRGLETAEGLREKVSDGNGFILVIIDDEMPIIFERCSHSLHIVSMAGKGIVSRFKEFVNACSLVAGYVGCSALSWNGRKGWSRLAAPYGITEGENGYKEIKI